MCYLATPALAVSTPSLYLNVLTFKTNQCEHSRVGTLGWRGQAARERVDQCWGTRQGAGGLGSGSRKGAGCVEGETVFAVTATVAGEGGKVGGASGRGHLSQPLGFTE